MGTTEEEKRLNDDKNKVAYWRRWGPYLSERQWGTVREDYSPDGKAWDYFPHEHARYRAYRWGEDGLCGLSDNHQRLCLAFAFWNGNDQILKERLFGLSGKEGNHGEDVKECYYYLDNTPTHSYMKYLYKYPQKAFPYEKLVAESTRRSREEPEYELMDTGIFDEDRYFDIFIECAKKTPNDLIIKVTVCNRGPEKQRLHLLPTLWFRNTWSWKKGQHKPMITVDSQQGEFVSLRAEHPTLGEYRLIGSGTPRLLFTENETNRSHLFGTPNEAPYVKDAFHSYVVNGQEDAVNQARIGSKAALYYVSAIEANGQAVFYLRLTDASNSYETLFEDAQQCLDQRKTEADAFYQSIMPYPVEEEHGRIERQAYAGMLWTKQFYYYVVEDWLKGDAQPPKPPAERLTIRNFEWNHLYNDDILSMPDKWEYPWFASWDMAFHCIPLALIDPEYAKKQLLLLTREWYMHPNGQIPAYEWNFSDVNPPVHAWAAWRVYKIEKKKAGKGDLLFLERVFQKLLLNFTWWVNRKDIEGKNIFQGGFLGLDNISLFDRSRELPGGGKLAQSDATAWMGMYCLNMLEIALELALHNESYEDIASKFFEHFLYVAEAMGHIGDDRISLWNEQEGFFYDVIHYPDGSQSSLKVRSLVGLAPLYGVMTIEPYMLKKLPGFRRRFEWFLKNRPDMCANVACMSVPGEMERRILSIVDERKLRLILTKMLDESEFLSPHGIRSLSAFHRANCFSLTIDSTQYHVDYEPGETSSWMFGGNSNWRGPIWFPVNFLLIESLQKYFHYYGNDFRLEFPTGSGKLMNLWEIAAEISHRQIDLFTKDAKGERPLYRNWPQKFRTDPYFDHILFYEYFNGDTGAGLGAPHQTGWTGLVAKLIQQSGEYCLIKTTKEFSRGHLDGASQ